MLASCVGAPQAQDKPKLVVFLVVDGLPQRQVRGLPRPARARRPRAASSTAGAWFADAHYGHAFTVTAAGHATMLTGAYPHRSGIIGNDWRDVHTGAEVVLHRRHLGHLHRPQDQPAGRHQPQEPARRRPWATCCAASMRRSKVIGISGKDRGAILPAGKTGTAYMYMGASGQFASSTFYMKRAPGVGRCLQCAQAGGPLFQDASGSRCCADAAYARSHSRQPAVVRPARRQAADDDGRGSATRRPDPRITAPCCAAPSPTSCRSNSRGPRSRASSWGATMRPTSWP